MPVSGNKFLAISIVFSQKGIKPAFLTSKFKKSIEGAQPLSIPYATPPHALVARPPVFILVKLHAAIPATMNDHLLIVYAEQRGVFSEDQIFR